MSQKTVEEIIADFKASVDAKTLKLEAEILELRTALKEGEISDQRANQRIEELEKDFVQLQKDVRTIMTELTKINTTINAFSPKLDRFMDNLWKVVFLLLVIVAGLVGIKLW